MGELPGMTTLNGHVVRVAMSFVRFALELLSLVNADLTIVYGVEGQREEPI